MRILYISGSYASMKDGIADSSKILFEQLYSKHYQVSLLTTNREDIKIYIETKEYRNTTNYLNNWKINLVNIRQITNLIRNEKVDIIHIEYPGKGYAFNLLINILPLILKINNQTRNVKISIRCHEFSQSRLLRKLVNIPLFLFSNYLFIPSFYDYKILKKIFRNKVEKINIGTNIPVSTEYVRKSVKDKNGCTIIGYFGFIYKNKGLENLLKIFNQLIKDGENCLLYIIGELDPAKPYHQEILKIISDYGIQDKIIITGYVSQPEDVSKHIEKIDFALLPFDDGLTLRRGSFLMFMHHNVPIITTSGDEECQKLFASKPYIFMGKSNDEIVEKCKEWINDEKKIKVDSSSYQSILEIFDWDIISNEFIGKITVNMNYVKKGEKSESIY